MNLRRFVEEVVAMVSAKFPWIHPDGIRKITETTLYQRSLHGPDIKTSKEFAADIVKEIEEAIENTNNAGEVDPVCQDCDECNDPVCKSLPLFIEAVRQEVLLPSEKISDGYRAFP